MTRRLRRKLHILNCLNVRFIPHEDKHGAAIDCGSPYTHRNELRSETGRVCGPRPEGRGGPRWRGPFIRTHTLRRLPPRFLRLFSNKRTGSNAAVKRTCPLPLGTVLARLPCRCNKHFLSMRSLRQKIGHSKTRAHARRHAAAACHLNSAHGQSNAHEGRTAPFHCSGSGIGSESSTVRSSQIDQSASVG